MDGAVETRWNRSRQETDEDEEGEAGVVMRENVECGSAYRQQYTCLIYLPYPVLRRRTVQLKGARVAG